VKRLGLDSILFTVMQTINSLPIRPEESASQSGRRSSEIFSTIDVALQSDQDIQEHENFSDSEDVESAEESFQIKKKRKDVRHALFEKRIYFLVHEETLDEANTMVEVMSDSYNES